VRYDIYIYIYRVKYWPADSSLEPKHVANCVLVKYTHIYFTNTYVIHNTYTCIYVVFE
jgi:hypothetical protein